MSVWKIGLLAALSAAGALSLVIMWSVRAPAETTHEEEGSVHSAQVRTELPTELPTEPEREQDPPFGAQRQEVGQPTEFPVGPELQLLPEDGTPEAVMAMLDDPAFQVACALPSEADFEVLSHLVAEARKIQYSFRAEEAERRLEAGLGERVEGYRPGEPFEAPPVKHGDESVSYRFRDSEAYRIVFPFKEYPYMYALRDQTYLLERELKRRNE